MTNEEAKKQLRELIFDQDYVLGTNWNAAKIEFWGSGTPDTPRIPLKSTTMAQIRAKTIHASNFTF